MPSVCATRPSCGWGESLLRFLGHRGDEAVGGVPADVADGVQFQLGEQVLNGAETREQPGSGGTEVAVLALATPDELRLPQCEMVAPELKGAGDAWLPGMGLQAQGE